MCLSSVWQGVPEWSVCCCQYCWRATTEERGVRRVLNGGTWGGVDTSLQWGVNIAVACFGECQGHTVQGVLRTCPTPHTLYPSYHYSLGEAGGRSLLGALLTIPLPPALLIFPPSLPTLLPLPSLLHYRHVRWVLRNTTLWREGHCRRQVVCTARAVVVVVVSESPHCVPLTVLVTSFHLTQIAELSLHVGGECPHTEL